MNSKVRSAIAAFVFAACYAGVGISLVEQWSTNYLYSFGFLVPVISGYMIWAKTDEIRSVLMRPDYRLGVPTILAGAAMLEGLQPIVTVFLARGWLGEQVSARQWTGLALGLVGVYFVVEHKIALGGTGPSGYLAIFLALAGISSGTIYQKRYCSSVDLRTGSVVQFVASAIAYVLVLPLLETYRLEWNAPVIFALAWSVLVLSVVAISVLYWLLRHGAAASVAGLFYLVPPATALEAYWLFGERLTGLAFAGMGLIAVGVALSRPTVSPRLVVRAVDRDDRRSLRADGTRSSAERVSREPRSSECHAEGRVQVLHRVSARVRREPGAARPPSPSEARLRPSSMWLRLASGSISCPRFARA